MKSKRALAFISIVIMLLFDGCKKDDDGYATPTPVIPPADQVYMQGNVFTPASITVAVNTTIVWTNRDGMAHTATSDNNMYDSGNIGNGGIFSHQFTTLGTFPYHCKIHSGMVGTVIVQ